MTRLRLTYKKRNSVVAYKQAQCSFQNYSMHESVNHKPQKIR